MWSLIAELWNTLIFEPVFNLITLLIAVVPWHNFGLALILFAIITRFLLHPLIKRQLLQIKRQKELQPEVMKIKQANKGNRQQETKEIMALYKKNNFNPFAALGYILLQLPLLIGLYQVINRVAADNQSLATDSYQVIQNLDWVEELAADSGVFDPTLFGTVDLTRRAFHGAGTFTEANEIASLEDEGGGLILRPADTRTEKLEYAVVADEADCRRSNKRLDFREAVNGRADSALAVGADDYLCLHGSWQSNFYFGAFAVVVATAFIQFFTAKQMLAITSDKKKNLRRIFKEQAEGKEVDQAEVSAAMNQGFIYVLPAIIFVFSIGLFAALPFYWLTSSLIQYFQQKRMDKQDTNGVKAKIDGQDASVTVERRLNAKEKKTQTSRASSAGASRRQAKRVAATSRTINREDNKKE